MVTLNPLAAPLQSLMVFLRVSLPFPPAARKTENTRSLLNDKREVVAQRQRYEQYSVVVEEVGVPRPPDLLGGTGQPRAPQTHASAASGAAAARRGLTLPR